MNPLLARQLHQHLPSIDAGSEPWRSFLAAVSETYDKFHNEQRSLSHTLEVTSSELTDANEKLRYDSAHQLELLNRSYQQTLELQQGMILRFGKTERGFEHTLCRGQLARRLGWSPESVEKKLPREVYPPNQIPFIEASYARAWNGVGCSFEARSADGKIVFLCLLRPLREGTEVREVIVSAVEITALKQLELDLRTAKETAETADRAKSEFLAVMSHEIRTPLNAILGFGQLLRDSPLSPEQRSWLDIIAASGESLRALIDDILDFSKIEAGMLDLRENPVVLPELLDSITAMFGPRISEKGLRLQVHLAPDLPEAIVTDASRLRQVIVNLVNNAVKFTEGGSVQIEVSVAERSETEEETRWLLRFEVRDTGIGIKEEHRDRLFRPFSQADSSTTRVYGGTGLGLAISKRLVKALGGEIDFTSEPGKGACFFFTIRTGDGSVRAPVPSIFSPTSLASLPKLRILVVEDHPTNRFLMRQIFRRFGYEADFAENGKEAVSGAANSDYDLIVMDLQMPEMGGIEATGEIRALLKGRRQPRIIALTASTMEEQHQHCRDVGMDAVLTKPVQLDVLFAELARTQPLDAV